MSGRLGLVMRQRLIGHGWILAAAVGLLLLGTALLAGGLHGGSNVAAHAELGAAQAGGGIVCSAFGGGPPYEFDAYEATRDRVPYLEAQRLAAVDQLLLPGDAFALQAITTGRFGARTETAGATIPAQLLHAIGWIESRLTQARLGVPFEGVGPVLISPSCAYGLMQVASFFSNGGDVPSSLESLVGTHYAYNVAAGAQILVDKWNQEFFPQVGDADPLRIESWYYATWAYNGWAFVNHPAGTEVDPFRTPYDCAAPFNGYPYQELVFGCVENPPSVDGVQLWDALNLRLPDLGTLAVAQGPLDVDVYFDGWASVFAAPFTDEEASSPFAGMNMGRPAGATIVAPPRFSTETAAQHRASIFALPELTVGESVIELVATEQGLESGTITIRNAGSGLLVYRLIPSVDWLALSVPAGIAVGSGVPLLASQTVEASIVLTPDADGLPEGLHQGSVVVEALLPDGAVVRETVVVLVDKQGVPRYEAGRPVS